MGLVGCLVGLGWGVVFWLMVCMGVFLFLSITWNSGWFSSGVDSGGFGVWVVVGCFAAGLLNLVLGWRGFRWGGGGGGRLVLLSAIPSGLRFHLSTWFLSAIVLVFV